MSAWAEMQNLRSGTLSAYLKSDKTALKSQNIAKIDIMSSAIVPASSENQKIGPEGAFHRRKIPYKKILVRFPGFGRCGGRWVGWTEKNIAPYIRPTTLSFGSYMVAGAI